MYSQNLKEHLEELRDLRRSAEKADSLKKYNGEPLTNDHVTTLTNKLANSMEIIMDCNAVVNRHLKSL